MKNFEKLKLHYDCVSRKMDNLNQLGLQTIEIMIVAKRIQDTLDEVRKINKTYKELLGI